MDKKCNFLIALCTVLAAALPPVTVAQEGASGVEDANPVEMFACNWRPGKGMNDLLRVTKSWNSWADDNAPGYSAWILSPYLGNTDNPMEVGWIGSWFTGQDMAATMSKWLNERDGIGADFDKVVDCANSHFLMASYPLQPRTGPPGSGPVWFAKCKLQPGVQIEQAMEAHARNVAIMRGRDSGILRQGNVGSGVDMSSWVFVPALGGGKMDFDYYSVVYHGSYADLGTQFNQYFNSGGMKRAWSNMRDVAQCENPILYDARNVRVAQRN